MSQPLELRRWAAGCWSGLGALTGAATGFTQLLLIRSLFGFAEGRLNSTTNRVITNRFPREETSRTIGLTFSGQTVAIAIAIAIAGPVIGLLWVVVWRYLITDPPKDNPRVSAAEVDLVAASRAVSVVPPEDRSLPLRSYLLQSSTLSLGLGMFAVGRSP